METSELKRSVTLPFLILYGVGTLVGAVFPSFYAFIGFEDMVNMAEEEKDVRRTMPLAVLSSIALTTLLYVVVIVMALAAAGRMRDQPVRARVSGLVTPASLSRGGCASVSLTCSNGDQR